MNTPPALLRTAYFGGSFDPPHLGHLAVARAALAAGKCDEVWFSPSLHQPFKLDRKQASFADRAAMTELLIQGEPGCRVCRIEDELALDPSYTIDVLHACARRYPERRFLLLIGGDSLRDLARWHRAAELVRDFEVLTYPREGATPSAAELRQTWPPETAETLAAGIIPGKFFNISSTEWRNGVAISAERGNINKEAFFSDAVQTYVRQKKLY